MAEVRTCLHFLVICLYITKHGVAPCASGPWCDVSFPGYGYEYGYFADQQYVTSTTKPILRRDTAGNLELVSVPATPAPLATTATTAVPNHEPNHRPHHQQHHQPNHQLHHQHHHQLHHQPHDQLHQPHHQLHPQLDHQSHPQSDQQPVKE